MNAESRRKRVDDRLIAVVVGTDQIDDPHLVVVTDATSGVPTYFGPYPDAATALRDAEILSHELRERAGEGEGGGPVTAVVARIYAPTAPGPGAAGRSPRRG